MPRASGTSRGPFLPLVSPVVADSNRIVTLDEMITFNLMNSAAYVLKRDSATDITITQMFITLVIMLEVY